MKRNIWKMIVLFLFCAILLTACGSGMPQMVSFTGLVTQLQAGDEGDLTAFVIQSDGGQEVGILLTEETIAHLPGRDSAGREDLPDFQAALRPELEINAECYPEKTTLTTAGGGEITAYAACIVRITGWLERGAVTLRDGTAVDVMHSYNDSTHSYRLADGTKLLDVYTPYGPEDVYYAGEGFNGLGRTARAKVLDYYDARGPLYDEQAELEKVYALYQTLGADFCSGFVSQHVSPVASSERVKYFLTTAVMPTGSENGDVYYELRLGDAFDRETGAHIDTWDLFTVTRETVIAAILDETGVDDPVRRSEMEAALLAEDARIMFFNTGLEVNFAPGTLSDEEHAYGYFLEYRSVIDLIQDWALPKA